MENQRRLLDETEVKRIEELLNDKNMRVSWKDGVLEDYFYTKEILSAKKKSKSSNAFLLPLIIAFILFVSIADLPYGYYQAMRIIVPVLSVIYLYCEYTEAEKFKMMFIPNILIVILWNPILPVYLDKETWVVIDAIAGICEIVVAYFAYRLSRDSD